jgi:aryl-alcohol dehydrogenase-like predicted oxidoreductase
MIRVAEGAGLVFDTASAYGVAEELLGSCLSPRVAVTTKLLPLLSSHPDHLTRLVAGQILASRTRLGRNNESPVGVMFHSPQQGAEAPVVAALLAARDAGLCQHAGTSVYFPSEFDALVHGQDIVQFPYSVFDRRFAEQGVFQRARERGITVYARAPFCQGLVVMEPERVPERLAHARPHVRTFQGICAEHGVRPAEAALRFALESPADYVVFGVDTMAQLEADLAVAKDDPSPTWLALKDALTDALRDLPEAVVVPSLWAKA